MAGKFPVLWTREGIALHFGAYRDEPGLDPLDTRDIGAVVLRWHEVREVAAVDPWPRVRVAWSGPGGGDEHTFAPVRDSTDAAFSGQLTSEPFAVRAAALIEHVVKHAPAVVDRGWLDLDEVSWEQVASLPELPGERPVVGDGAFRAAPRPVEEEAVALREAPTPYEAMLDWLASSPERPWRAHPRRVRTSTHSLYVERRDRTLWRLPLEALRLRVGAYDEDAYYIFGRRTAVLLTHRDGCPVRKALDARLKQRRAVERAR